MTFLEELGLLILGLVMDLSVSGRLFHNVLTVMDLLGNLVFLARAEVSRDHNHVMHGSCRLEFVFKFTVLVAGALVLLALIRTEA